MVDELRSGGALCFLICGRTVQEVRHGRPLPMPVLRAFRTTIRPRQGIRRLHQLSFGGATVGTKSSPGTLMIIALAGRRIDAPSTSTPTFPLPEVDKVREKLAALFESEGATALASSAACGADLIALD